MRNLTRGLALGALFVAVVIAGGLALHRVDPFREVSILREKWDYWREHKDEYDTVFIGTSRTYRGVDPVVFDELTAAAGVPTHSYNFGVDAMLPPEDAYVSDYILREPPRNLRWVFIELGVFVDDFGDRDPDTVRSRHWHDWRRSSLCIQSNLWPKAKKEKWEKWFQSEKGNPWPADLAWTHLRLFGVRFLNLGRGAAELNEWMTGKGANPQLLGPRRDGFNPYPKSTVLAGDALKAYENALAERQKSPARLSPLKPAQQRSLDDMVQRVRELKAKPIALIAPSTGSLRLRPAPESNVPLVDLCDVQGHPELFVPEVRVDHAHLNQKGADLFTRQVAGEFIEIAKQAR